MYLTGHGYRVFYPALQGVIRYAKLLDDDGKEIQGWNYAPKVINPGRWEGPQYGEKLTWIFMQEANSKPVIIAGLGWADSQGEILAREALVDPFVISKTGQTLMVEPFIRLTNDPFAFTRQEVSAA